MNVKQRRTSHFWHSNFGLLFHPVTPLECLEVLSMLPRYMHTSMHVDRYEHLHKHISNIFDPELTSWLLNVPRTRFWAKTEHPYGPIMFFLPKSFLSISWKLVQVHVSGRFDYLYIPSILFCLSNTPAVSGLEMLIYTGSPGDLNPCSNTPD